MNGPAEDIARLIATNGLATFAGTSGWSVNVGVVLDSPDQMITISDSGSLPADTISDVEIDNWVVQFRVRGRGIQEVRDKIDTVMASINLKKYYEVVDGATTIRYIVMYRSTLPEFIGTDERNRPIYVFNMSGLRTWT